VTRPEPPFALAVSDPSGQSGRVGTSNAPRRLTLDDVPWIADMLVERRRLYATFSPVFWNPAENAREVHAPYLASLVSSDRHCGYRTERGSVLAELQEPHSAPWWSEVPVGFVDDFAVVTDDCWHSDGVPLLRAVWQEIARRGAQALRVVTARRDDAKVGMLQSLGLTIAESWWVKVSDVRPVAKATLGPITAHGVEGAMMVAPPVYDPGGPVFLVASRATPAVVRRVIRVATDHGGRLRSFPSVRRRLMLPTLPRRLGLTRCRAFTWVSPTERA
jgi:hypothetical protein